MFRRVTCAARSRHLSCYRARGGGGEGGGEELLQADRSAVGVFWDCENCHVPSSLDPFLFRPNIEQTLRNCGFLGPISIRGYGNIHLIPTHVLQALSETGIDLHHVPQGGKNATDRALLIDMLLWTMKHAPPAHVLLISEDSDFSVLLHKICLLGYNALLACPKRSPRCSNSALVSAANIVWGWPDIVMGPGWTGHEQTCAHMPMSEEEYKKKQCKLSQVQPEDDGRDEVMKSKDGNGGGDEVMKSRDGNGEEDVKDQDSLRAALLEQIVAIVESCPGITLGEMSKELKSLNVNPTSSGYKNVYHFLTSIEQVEVRFVDGARMRDRVTLYVAGGKSGSTVPPTAADSKAGRGKVPVSGTRRTWLSQLYDSVRGIYGPKTWFTRN